MSLAIDRDKPRVADKPTLFEQTRFDIERRIVSGDWRHRRGNFPWQPRDRDDEEIRTEALKVAVDA